MTRPPTPEEASQFALMLHVGLPAEEALLYFLSEEEAMDPINTKLMLNRWLRSPAVSVASERHMGAKWTEMTLESRVKVAIDKHHSEMAYFLYSRNYTNMAGAEFTKAQEARKVLEARIAGTSGTVDPLTAFLSDLTSGRVKLPVPSPVQVLN